MGLLSTVASGPSNTGPPCLVNAHGVRAVSPGRFGAPRLRLPCCQLLHSVQPGLLIVLGRARKAHCETQIPGSGCRIQRQTNDGGGCDFESLRAREAASFIGVYRAVQILAFDVRTQRSPASYV